MSFIRDSKAVILLTILFLVILTVIELKSIDCIDRFKAYLVVKDAIGSQFMYSGVLLETDTSVNELSDTKSITESNSEPQEQITLQQTSIIHNSNPTKALHTMPEKKVKWGRRRQRKRPIPSTQPPTQSNESESPDVSISPTNSTEKDYHVTRFSRRFRLSNHAIMMSKLEYENLTYFPRDHVTDGHVFTLRKLLTSEEKSIMQDQYPLFESYVPFYQNFSYYLGSRYVYFKKYWTEDEKDAYQGLSGEKRERYSHYLYKRYEDKLIESEKQLNQKREDIMKSHRRFVSEGKCEGCRYQDMANYHVSKHYYGTIRKFKGNKEVFTIYNSTFYRYPSPDTPFSITGVCVTTMDRLSILPQLLYRWEGPLVVVLNGPATREGEMITFINNNYLPDRLIILMYLMGMRYSGGFPVNMLRNMGIRNIETTHYQILDMDLWPTTNTYSVMMKLPPSLHEGKNAVIFPVFFYNRKAVLTRCDNFKSCAMVAVEGVPENKLQLEACLHSKVCISSKPGIRTHIYIMPEWYKNTNTLISRIRCFTADFQEPYVLLRYHPDTPLFDERFVDYGYNKVQLFEHLRAAGYTFYIWNSIFAMDLPHPDSSFRKAYISQIKGEYSDMREVYKQFQAELNLKYKFVQSSRICFSLQKRYFLAIDS